MTFEEQRAGERDPPDFDALRGRLNEYPEFNPASRRRVPRDDAGGSMKRRYTMDQYRADVAKLQSPWREGPSVNGALAEALADGAELMPAEDEPEETVAQSRPPPAKPEFVQRFSGLRQRVRRGNT